MISSALVGLTFRVYRCLGVRSFSLTSRSSRLMLQYSARSAISMNLSTSKISTGIFFALAGSYRASLSILSFVVPARRNWLVCVQSMCRLEWKPNDCRAKGVRLAKCLECKEFFAPKNMKKMWGAQIRRKKLQLLVGVYKCPKNGGFRKAFWTKDGLKNRGSFIAA